MGEERLRFTAEELAALPPYPFGRRRFDKATGVYAVWDDVGEEEAARMRAAWRAAIDALIARKRAEGRDSGEG